MMNEENVRQIRGYSILAKGDNPIMINEETFLVPSQSSNQKYKVTKIDGWSCECKDFKYRKQICKHIYAIQFWLRFRESIDSHDLMELENTIESDNRCVFCKSQNIVRNGSRNTKSGIRQRYLCKDCKKRFVIEPIKHVKGNSKIVTLTMDLYFKGLSLRDIADTVYQFYGLKLHHETIRRWIMRFTEIMSNYVNKLKPTVSDAWHVDEQNIKIKGKWLWSWNCLDEETRFLLANAITRNREINDARQVFQNAKAIANVNPEFIVTDGLLSYEKAIKKEFSTWRLPQTKHVKLRTIRDTRANNNLIERYHSTFRERDKVMRGFKSRLTTKQLSEGFRTYYNFIRKHQGLNGLTPSQKANLDLQLERNRWLSLLKKSLENNQIVTTNGSSKSSYSSGNRRIL